VVSATLRSYLPEFVAGLLVGTAGVGSIALFLTRGTVTWAFAVIWGAATLGSVALVPAVARSGSDWRKELRTLFGASLGVGVVSILTGIGNNATDEPFTMPSYLGVLLRGQDPYTTSVTVTYTARTLDLWSSHVSSQFHYVYLPLLLFFQIPGTGAEGYKAMCLACWVGIVYLLRKDRFASLCLVSPVAALVAANGFTDLPVLLLMTFSLRGGRALPGKAAEYATYAMKQFANAFWIVYYLAKRDALRAGVVVALTLLFAAPFIVWHPTGIWCEALTFSLSPGCASAANSSRQLSDLYSHWNYYLWILWVYALYHTEIHRLATRTWSAITRRTEAPAPAT
jgi:hypothetical protein